MIISRTPFRISLFGGGTDYPDWIRHNGGAVIAGAIDKYCYISCRFLPPFFEHKIRIVYSKIENCMTIDEIAHPAVRETLKYLRIEQGVEIHHDADLPARSGMGSSSAFTVGLLNALYAIKGQMASKHQLAMEGIHIEQDLLKETVGCQDQVLAAYGGLNRVTFLPNGEIVVKPMTLLPNRVTELNSQLMLFYTGIRRTASDIASSFVPQISDKHKQLDRSRAMVDECCDLLCGGGDISGLGELLDEYWQLKRSLSPAVSNPEVDEMYEAAREAGALGGKLTGAGGGGFLLLLVPSEKQAVVKERLHGLTFVPFKFDQQGSQIIFYDLEADYAEQA